MATYKSDIIRAKDSLDVSGKSLSGEKTGAQVLYATAHYDFKPKTATPVETNGDVILLADIPAGATVVPELSYVAKSFATPSLIVRLGDGSVGGAERFGTVGNGQPEGVSAFGYEAPSHAFFGKYVDGVVAPYEKTTRVQATLTSVDRANMPTTAWLKFGIAYRVQG